MKLLVSKEWCMKMAELEGDAEIGAVSPELFAEFNARKDAVFVAARQADHRYDGAAPDSQGMTRAEYVGRAVLAALQ